MDSEIERTTMRKLALRIGLFCGLLYFMNWLDRNNVGFAALQMNKELAFGPAVYGLGASMFFAGFFIFEIPSNLALIKMGARGWIARILIAWGLVACATAAIQNVPGFYILRFILGAAEAGFTPGLVLYFSYWVPRKYRARAFAMLFATPLLASVIGGPLSGWLMTALNGMGGISGWRWMFLLEGLPTVALGIICLFYLTDAPRHAAWLSEAEKTWLTTTLDREQAETPPKSHDSLSAFIGDGRLWALVAVYFFWSMSGYGFVLWLPQIISAATGFTPVVIGLISAVPFIFAILGLTLIGRWSDRSGERKRPILLFAVAAGLALIAAGWTGSPMVGYALLCVAGFCIWAQQAVFWTLPASYLTGASAASGIALVNMGAAAGGFVAPYAIGLLRQSGGSFAMALAGLGLTSLIVALIVAMMRINRHAPANA